MNISQFKRKQTEMFIARQHESIKHSVSTISEEIRMIQKRIQEQAQSQKERETDFLCKICPVKKYKSDSDVQPSKHDAREGQG